MSEKARDGSPKAHSTRMAFLPFDEIERIEGGYIFGKFNNGGIETVKRIVVHGSFVRFIPPGKLVLVNPGHNL